MSAFLCNIHPIFEFNAEEIFILSKPVDLFPITYLTNLPGLFKVVEMSTISLPFKSFTDVPST